MSLNWINLNKLTASSHVSPHNVWRLMSYAPVSSRGRRNRYIVVEQELAAGSKEKERRIKRKRGIPCNKRTSTDQMLARRCGIWRAWMHHSGRVLGRLSQLETFGVANMLSKHALRSPGSWQKLVVGSR